MIKYSIYRLKTVDKPLGGPKGQVSHQRFNSIEEVIGYTNEFWGICKIETKEVVTPLKQVWVEDTGE